jgi:hypothetical protein
MGIFFQKYCVPLCCLCGKPGLLTGEHKIKAAMLKQEFGKQHLSIHRIDGLEDRARTAQSIKSKHLKFESKICQSCNGARTQMPDREFDRFSTLALQRLRLKMDSASPLSDNAYRVGSSSYLNLFRYFAKILCCHLAEIDAPIPRRISQFAIGKIQCNYVFLDIRRDWTYKQAADELGEFKYAAHGGLFMSGNRMTNAPEAFHSTITIGPLQYVFSVYLAPIEVLELRCAYREFYDLCCSYTEFFKQAPLSEEHQRSLGFLEWI